MNRNTPLEKLPLRPGGFRCGNISVGRMEGRRVTGEVLQHFLFEISKGGPAHLSPYEAVRFAEWLLAAVNNTDVGLIIERPKEEWAEI